MAWAMVMKKRQRIVDVLNFMFSHCQFGLCFDAIDSVL